MTGRDHADPLRALVAGQWSEWTGLPADLRLQTLRQVYGGATLMDSQAVLGSAAVACCCSSLNDRPVLVWHDGEHVLRVVHDRLDQPLRAPHELSPFVRLEVVQGARRVAGGEWVDVVHGLALLVTPDGQVIEVAGFAPTTQQDYVARLRPTRRLPVPMPSPKDTRS